MEKSIIQDLVSSGFSTREIAEKISLSQTATRYWLKKFQLKTNPKNHKRDIPHRCYLCGETNPEKFYGNKKRACGKCHNAYTKKIGQEKRRKAVECLGGKCIYCSFDKWICSLQIHHLDPSTKDHDFMHIRSWSWKRIEKEIEGCVLLCSNCHAAVHAGEIELG
jgi:hypothetical protein